MELEFLVMLVRGLLKNYETITIKQINRVLHYINLCINAHIENVYAFNSNY